jgi:ethanolamine utilization cobalamin adenosyltransferase
LYRDLKILNKNEQFPTVQSIIDAMKGFIEEPELDDEVIEEETTVDTDKDFIRELIEEPKTFQVGSLIKRIWSGLKIPCVIFRLESSLSEEYQI